MYKSFQHGSRKLDVLRGVNLQLDAGEMVTIIGASGAGKSTLLHCLGTLDLPTSGEILFHPPGGGTPTDITRLPPPDLAEFRNRTIGFVFQFHHLLPEFSALENAMMPALIARIPTRQAREQAEHMLAKVGMSHRLAHRPGELSGGEQQRVALARAFCTQPKILFADEPTGNLDQRTGGDIIELMTGLNREAGTTLVLVTHDADLAGRARRILRLADGRLVSDAPA